MNLFAFGPLRRVLITSAMLAVIVWLAHVTNPSSDFGFFPMPFFHLFFVSPEQDWVMIASWICLAAVIWISAFNRVGLIVIFGLCYIGCGLSRLLIGLLAHT
jgi:hypothetical protein